MFLFEGDFLINQTVIRGVVYQTTSFYSGYKDIFQKVGELIDESFRTANVDNITNDSSSDSDIAIDEP